MQTSVNSTLTLEGRSEVFLFSPFMYNVYGVCLRFLSLHLPKCSEHQIIMASVSYLERNLYINNFSLSPSLSLSLTRTHTHTHAYIYIYILYIYIYGDGGVCVCVCLCMSINTSICVYVYLYMYIYTNNTCI